jgi:F-type H+-transporting ATPase subunit epsilon
MQSMDISIISPEQDIFKGRAEMVVIPGEDGDFTAMYEHAPIITYLRPGRLEVIEDEKKEIITYFVRGGFVKVEENQCLIMVDYIKNIKNINIKAIESEIDILRNKLDAEVNDVIKKNILTNIDLLDTEISIVKK